MSDTAAVNSGSRPRKRRNSSKNRPSSGRPSSISQVMQVMGKLLGALLLLLTSLIRIPSSSPSVLNVKRFPVKVPGTSDLK